MKLSSIFGGDIKFLDTFNDDPAELIYFRHFPSMGRKRHIFFDTFRQQKWKYDEKQGQQ